MLGYVSTRKLHRESLLIGYILYAVITDEFIWTGLVAAGSSSVSWFSKSELNRCWWLSNCSRRCRINIWLSQFKWLTSIIWNTHISTHTRWQLYCSSSTTNNLPNNLVLYNPAHTQCADNVLNMQKKWADTDQVLLKDECLLIYHFTTIHLEWLTSPWRGILQEITPRDHGVFLHVWSKMVLQLQQDWAPSHHTV